MSAKINDGLTNKQRFILRHKERLLIVWREEKRRAYAQHRDSMLAKRKAWRAANPDKVREMERRKWIKKQQWRRDNPELAKAFDKQLYWKHREYYLQYNKFNAAARLAITRDWYQSRMSEQSRAKKSVSRQRRRALVAQAPGAFTVEDVQEKLRLQNGKCYWCHKPHGTVYHIDHVIPLVKGGTNDKDNIVIAYAKCNLSKKDKLPSEFAGVLL